MIVLFIPRNLEDMNNSSNASLASLPAVVGVEIHRADGSTLRLAGAAAHEVAAYAAGFPGTVEAPPVYPCVQCASTRASTVGAAECRKEAETVRPVPVCLVYGKRCTDGCWADRGAITAHAPHA